MQEIKVLLKIITQLKDKYEKHGRHFSLDGKLVGDIGEVLCAEKYGLELYRGNFPIYDAFQIGTEKKVQIKSSLKNYCYFAFGEEIIPDYFLAVNILENDEVEKDLQYLINQGHKKLSLICHPMLKAYIKAGPFYKTLQVQWWRKFGVWLFLRTDNSLPVTVYNYVDNTTEEIIKL